MTGTTATKPYESLPQPNEAKPITIDTFSWWPVQVARIQHFNGVKNDIQTMAVYSHLLGWKKTTGEVRPSQQYIADGCRMGLSTVQKTVKKLVAMGWITASPVRKPGSKEISHTNYTVKDPEIILAELNAELQKQGDAAVTVVKNKSKESKNDGKSKSKEPNHTAVDAATVGNGEHNCLQQLVDHRVDAVSPHDEVSEEDDPPFPEEKQEPKQNPAVQTERNIAHPNKLSNWINGGDDEGFMAYGKLWGETKPRKIADLIRNHYQITQKDEAQGFKSVANNEHSGADIHYPTTTGAESSSETRKLTTGGLIVQYHQQP